MAKNKDRKKDKEKKAEAEVMSIVAEAENSGETASAEKPKKEKGRKKKKEKKADNSAEILERLTSALEGIEKRVNTLENSFIETVDKISKLESTVAKITSDYANPKEVVSAIKEIYSEINDFKKKTDVSVLSIAERIEKIESGNSDVDINLIKKDILEIKKCNKETTATISKISDEIQKQSNTMNETVENLSRVITALK